MEFTAGNVTVSLKDDVQSGGVQGQLPYVQGHYHAYVEINPVEPSAQQRVGLLTESQLKMAKAMLQVVLERNFPRILEVVDADGRNGPSSLGLEIRRTKDYPLDEGQAWACFHDNRSVFDLVGRMIQAAFSVPVERSAANEAEVSHAERAKASKPRSSRQQG